MGTDDDELAERIPDALFEATDEDYLREKNERETIKQIERLLKAGQITAYEADKMLVELAMKRFDHFTESTQALVRRRAEELIEATPEVVESRKAVADRYGAESGNNEEVRTENDEKER